MVSQTWLIDILYCVISQCEYGDDCISEQEILHLVSLYNDYYNCSEILSNKQINIWLLIKTSIYGIRVLYFNLNKSNNVFEIAEMKDNYSKI